MGNCLDSSSFSSAHHPQKPSSALHSNPSSSGTSTFTVSTTTDSLATTATTTTTTSQSQFSEAGRESISNGGGEGRILESPNLKVFTFADLKSASRNFQPDSLLGEGGFGRVYKGWLDERTLAPSRPGIGLGVAIKKLNPDNGQGFEEWQSEVNFLGKLSHPNLVKLLGYCWDETELLLVYEFLQRGSLENHLFRRHHSIQPLSWDMRLKIAIGAARGLAFLHSSEKQIIYRDFKASNILLDVNYNVKISDFGLAKLGPLGANTHVTTRVMGTYGYAAPEYVATGHLYVKSDVYGFGVVLLEIITGSRAFDTRRPRGQHNLVEWLKPLLLNKRKLKPVMDSRMEGQYSSKAMLQIAQVTRKCLEHEPRNRPSMREVLEVLEQLDATKEKPRGSASGSTAMPLPLPLPAKLYHHHSHPPGRARAAR